MNYLFRLQNLLHIVDKYIEKEIVTFVQTGTLF